MAARVPAAGISIAEVASPTELDEETLRSLAVD
jgi:hypothetical protein